MPISPPTQFLLATGQVITPDTCTAINHGSQAEATTHPVEDGSSIADHIIKKPNTVSLTTSWTPRPWDETYLPSGPTRGQDAFDILSGVLQRRETLTIDAEGIVYSPVVLLSVSMARQFEDGDGRTIQVEAQEIQIVSGKTVKVKQSKSLRGKGKKKKTQVPLTRAQTAIAVLGATVVGPWATALGIGNTLSYAQ